MITLGVTFLVVFGHTWPTYKQWACRL